MKKIIISLSLLISCIALFGSFEFFPGNPANIADRNYTHITFPGLTYEFNINNTLLQLDDINMFQEGRLLTEGEKKKLTSGNLDLLGDFKTTILDFGNKNWNFSFEAISAFKLGVLDKTYSKIVFYGNEVNHPYSTEVGKGSEAFAYWKASFAYALPFDLNLGMISGVFPAETDNVVLSTLRDMPISVGANLNINYSFEYGGLIESSQEFGSLPEQNYYDINALYVYTDEKSTGSMNPSLGFGFKAKILDGFFHFDIDDIFLQLTYRNLAGGEFVKVGVDSLLYLQEGHEIFEIENSENDSLRLDKHTVKIKPSISIGAEYAILNNLDVMMKYSSNELIQTDGFAIGASYLWDIVPFQAIFGFSENSYYRFQTGLKFSKFEWATGLTFYHGFFRYAEGIGLNSSIDFRF
ncbi:MAG: hypothetical protein Q7J16_01875 [Candidatus Cloacimonadales bacterium]|nr:hypothetical protein [Candidatus Cloacimonadales bacterium]